MPGYDNAGQHLSLRSLSRPTQMMPMLEMSAHRDRSEILEFRSDWERLASEQSFSFPNFDELVGLIDALPEDVMLLARRVDGKLVTLACVYRAWGRKAYRAGERRLFSLPVHEVLLFGSSMLGRVDPGTVAAMLDAVGAEFRFHVLTLGETSVDSPLYTSVDQLRSRFLIAELSRKRSLRWLIRLPADFESYMMSLGSKSRQNIRREMRQLDKQFACDFQTVTSEAQVEPFLAASESISRKTYQWNVGQRMLDDEPTRRSLKDRARRAELRCYSLSLNGQPCAFMRGKLVGGVFEFETAGFDPDFGKASPGAVLLMWAVRDLIENSTCTVFDFGQGGDNVGYKARFGSESHQCAALQLGSRRNPYALLLFGLQGALFAFLNMANKVVGNGAFRARVKRALRKYGDH